MIQYAVCPSVNWSRGYVRLSCVERRGCESLDEADEVYIPRGIGCSSRSGGGDRESMVVAAD